MSEAVKFDPFAPETMTAGPSAYSQLAKQCPVYRYRSEFDFFIDSNYQEIKEVILKNHGTWTFRHGPGPRDVGVTNESGLVTDPPVHEPFRLVIQRAFSATKLAKLAKDIDRIADELIGKMLDDSKGEGDFYQLFAMPLPSRLMCIMLGTPEANYLKYKAWADTHFYLTMNSPVVGAENDVTHEFGQHFFELIQERRDMLRQLGIETPTLEHVGTALPDDLMSRFICDRVQGRPLNDLEILGLGVAILLGGNETTMNLIGNLLWRLLEVPSRWEMLKANPALIEGAIEESLRFDPPVLGMFRKATHAAELGGCPIPASARVMYSIAGANRDANMWSDPDEFRLNRPADTQRKHLSFGGGNHLCLGFQLARMEVKQVFGKLIDRMPDLRLAGPTERARGFNVWGRRSLPVAWR